MLTLDTRQYDKDVDAAAQRTRQKLGGGGAPAGGGGGGGGAPAGGGPVGPTSEERRAAAAAESLQRQRSSALIAEERRQTAAVESLQRQRSAALIREWDQEQREHARAQGAMFRATQESEDRRLAAHRATSDQIKQVTVAMAAAVVLTIATIGAASVAAAMKLDSLMRSLAAVAGSQRAAEEQFARAREIAKLPGLGIQEAIEGLVKLQAASTGLKELSSSAARLELAETTLKRFGNALATVGKGKAELSGVNEQVAQILGKNKIMAQDIRILSEYVPQLRGAISAAFGTADTEALQKRGIGAVEFLTKVNAELGKLPQVTGGPRNALENFGDAVFLASAKIGENFLPAVTKILELATPLVMALAESSTGMYAAATAAVALSVAFLTLNTSAVPATINLVLGLVSSVRLLGQVMVGTAGLVQGAAATAVAATAGWVALAAVIGGLIYGIYSLATAEREIVAATDEQVEATERQVSLRQNELELLRSLGDGTRATADEQRKQKEIYDALDASGRARVDAMAEETSRTQALAEETRRLLETERERQRVQGANLAAKFALELEKLNRLTAEQAGAEQFLLGIERERLRVAREAAQGYRAPETFAEQPDLQPAIDAASNRSQELNAELETQDKLVRGLALSLINYRDTTEHSIESAFDLARTLGLSQKATASLVAEVERLSKEQKSAAGQVDEVTAALERQLKAASELAGVYDEQSKKRRQLIESTLTNIANSSGGDVGLAKEQLRQYLNDPVFREAVNTERSVKRLRKALEEVIDPTKVRHQKDAVEKLSDRLKQLKADVASFSDLRSPSFETRFHTEDLERVKRDYERILNLRRELGLSLRAALPGPEDLAGIEQMRLHLESLSRVRQGVMNATDDARRATEDYAVAVATKAVPAINAGVLAETKYLKAVRERAQAEHDLVADVVVQQRLRADAVRDGARRTAMAYGDLKLKVLKDLEELDQKLAENAVLAAVLGGRESNAERELVGRVKIEAPRVPTELETIASEAVKHSGYLSNIEALLSGKSGGSQPAGRVAVNSKQFQPEFEAALGGLLSFLKANGLDPSIKSGARDAAEQNALFRRLGTSRTPHDGYKSISPHQTGTGADIGFPASQRAKGQALIEQYLKAHPESGLENAFVKGRREPWHVQIAELHRTVLGGSAGQTAAPEASSSWWDTSVAAVKSWAPKVAMALLLAIGSGGAAEAAEQIDSNALGNDSVLSMMREAAAKRGQADVGAAKNAADIEIAENEGRLHNQLIDFETDLKLTRSRNALQRERADRATAISIKVVEQDLYDLRAGNEEAVARAQAKAREAHVSAQLQTAAQIQTLQYEIAHAAEGAADRYQLAWLEAIRGVQKADEEAVESQIRSTVRLSDAAVVHSEQVKARVLEHLASQKTATESYAETITSVYDSITGVLAKGISRLTGGVQILDNLLASIVNRLVSRVFQRFLDAFIPAGGGGGGGGASFSFAGGVGGGTSITSSLTRSFFGGGSGVQSGGSFGVNLPPGLRDFFGVGGGSGVAGAPPVPGSLMAGTSNQFAGLSPDLRRDLSLMALDDPGLLGGGGGGISSLFGQGGFGGMLRGPVAQMLPLLGVGLGMGLGGQSAGGRALGGIGGGLAGMLGMGLLQGGGLGGLLGGQVGNLMGFLGLGGALGAATLGIGAAVALIGAWALGRNKQRREDEKKRNTYANELGTAVWQMITDMKGGRLDASSAMSQLSSLEQQYLKQANSIKDSKTRRHALLWFNNPPETGDYQAAKKIFTQVANEQLDARARAQNQVPEYAGGLDRGLVGQHLIKVKPGERYLPPEAVAELIRNGGLIPGSPSALDNTYMYAPTGSAVLNEDQQRAMQGDGVRMLPVPAGSQSSPLAAGSGGGTTAAPVINLSGLGFNVTIIEGGRRDEKDVILEVMSSHEGGRVIARHTAKAKVHNRG